MGATSVLKRTILLLSAILLAAAGGRAQILVDGNSSETVTLTSSVQFQNISVTSSAATPFTITVSETDVPIIDWVRACAGTSCATGHSAAGNGTTNTTLSVEIINDLASQGIGPFHATVTLTPAQGAAATVNVVFAPGQSVTNPTPVTPSSLTVGVASGGSAMNMLNLQNNTGAALNITQITTTTTDGNNWLAASANPTNIPANGSSTITVTTTAGSLPNNTYTGSIQIFLSSSPMVTVPVTFTVGASGLTLSTVNLGLSYVNGTSQSQSVTVSGVTNYTATASTTSGGNWLILSAGSQNGTQVSSVPAATPFTVLVGQAAAQLTSGNYSGSIVVTDASNSANMATISVTLSVSTSGATSITVSQSSLSFFSQTNIGNLPYQTLVLSAPTGDFTAIATSDKGWLFLSNNAGSIPANLQVTVANLTGLKAGNYNGNIALMVGSLSQNIPVTLTITDNPVAQAGFTNPPLPGTGGTVLFTSIGSTATPSSQQVAVFASDNSALTISVNSSPSWLTVTQSGDQLTMTPNVSGLGAAVYSGNVVVTANNAAATITNSPISIPVVLVTNGGSTGALTITTSQALSFQSTASGVTPTSVIVTVTAATATQFTVSSTSWVSVSYSGNLVTPQTLTVSINPSGLTTGTYTGAINLTAGGVTQVVPVSLTVLGGTATGTISADQQSLSFIVVTGGQAQSQMVTVSSSGGPVSYTVSVSGPGLTASPTSGQTQSQVTITANPAGLAAGNYQGTVTITSANTLTIPVSFTVQPLPVVSAGTTNLTFTYLSGGSAPAAQNVLISGSTGTFTAAAASDTGSWLAVSPTSGPAGASIAVSVNPSGISLGQHTGTITVTGTNGLTGQVIITVSLAISAALPSVSTVVNGASFLAGPISPGEVITVFGTNLGPAGQTFTAQLDSTGKLATQLGGVQLIANGFLAPMIYVSATQVSAVVPYEMARYASAGVYIKYLGQTSNVTTLTVAATAPGIFTQNSSGSGPAGYNADFSLNGPNNAAPKGSTVVFFLTGEGQTIPPGVTGTINASANQNPAPAAPLSILIGGLPATYSYAAGIEGVVEGIMQLNVQIPANASSGNVSVVVIIGGNSTQGGVTISVR